MSYTGYKTVSIVKTERGSERERERAGVNAEERETELEEVQRSTERERDCKGLSSTEYHR